MESSSRIYTSPSFNKHSSSDIADIADRVVHELRAENGFGDDDVFSFSDDEVNSDNHTDEEDREFEFPVSTDDVITDDQISLRYPVFDTSLLSETHLNCVDSPVTKSKPRPSLRKLLSEDRDDPSTSSSETEELNGILPGTYCVWTPKTKTERPRGKHKKSNSVSIDNISKRWKFRHLFKRSYSDDNYTAGKESPVVVFLPPISPDQKTNNENTGKGGNPEKNIPAYKAKIGKIGNIRIPPHYQFRQGQVAAFANGSSTNLYRY